MTPETSVADPVVDPISAAAAAGMTGSSSDRTAAASDPSVADRAGAPPVPPLALAVTAAGAVAAVVGLIARWGASAGDVRHDAGATLVVVGVGVTLGGVVWQSLPYLESWRAARNGSGVGGRSLRWLVVVAVGAALLVGMAIGRGWGGGSAATTVTTEPSAPTTTVNAGAPSPDAGTATTIGQSSLGAILAAQGQGSNTPPPSIPGVSFPVGDGRTATNASIPWATAPLMPATVPPTPLNGTDAGSTSTTVAR